MSLVNELVNERGWRWITRNGNPYIREANGQIHAFRLQRGFVVLLPAHAQ